MPRRKKFESKEDVLPPVGVQSKKSRTATAAVTSVPKGDCECEHEKSLHYGPKPWCNFSGCNCQEYKVVR